MSDPCNMLFFNLGNSLWIVGDEGWRTGEIRVAFPKLGLLSLGAARCRWLNFVLSLDAKFFLRHCAHPWRRPWRENAGLDEGPGCATGHSDC